MRCAWSESTASGTGGKSIAEAPLPKDMNLPFPANDLTEDWLKLTDFDPENVVELGPVRARMEERSGVV